MLPKHVTLLKDFNLNAVIGHIKFLSSLNTRVTGYKESYIAAKYIEEQFKKMGLKVMLHYFNVTVPVDYGATIKVLGHPELNLKVYSFEPNFIVPNVAVNLTAPLVYVGKGDFNEIEGKKLYGSIALMDFNCHGRGKFLRRFGVKGIIYIEPPDTTKDEIFKKRYRLPIHFPRYLMPREDAMKLLSLLEKEKEVYVTLNSYMKWEKRKGINVVGILELSLIHI
mgnify:CR=1 FL=1